MSKAVLVTTDNRGVFFGYLESNDAPGSLTLSNARNVVYWSKATKGYLGLAADGPNSSSRVGPSVPSLTLYGITGIADCSPAAVEAWESAPWAANLN